MKKWFSVVILLFVFYFVFQFFFKMYNGGHHVNYTIKNNEISFNIDETYSSNKKDDLDNYFLSISNGQDNFSIQILNDFQKSEKIISNIYAVKTNTYSCILPIFKQDVIATDIICLNNDIQYNYYAIQGISEQVDAFAKSMQEKGYKLDNYTDKKDGAYQNSLYTLYRNNLVASQSFGFNTYKGINIVTNNEASPIKAINIFNKDVYDQSLVTMFKNYYVAPDYNSSHEFSKFYIVDIRNASYDTVTTSQKISFDSYIEGTVGNSVYLYDRENNVQYKIDASRLKVEVFGDETKGYKIYKNGNWEEKALKDMTNQSIYFGDEENHTINGYTFLKRTEKEYSGYDYYYKTVGNSYEIYRANVQDADKLTYIATISSLSNLHFTKDYFYFVDKDTIYYYNDLTGKRSLLKYNELEFNRNLDYLISSN